MRNTAERKAERKSVKKFHKKAKRLNFPKKDMQHYSSSASEPTSISSYPLPHRTQPKKVRSVESGVRSIFLLPTL